MSEPREPAPGDSEDDGSEAALEGAPEPPLTGIAKTAHTLAGLSLPTSKTLADLGALPLGKLGVSLVGLGDLPPDKLGLSLTGLGMPPGGLLGSTSALPPGGLAAGIIGSALASSGSALTGSLIEGWRKQLADAQAPVQRTIASQISTTFTGLGLGALGRLGLDELAQSRLVGVSAAVAELTEGWRKALEGSFSPLANSATKLLTEEFRAASARDRAGLERLRKLGWWVPPSEDYSFMRWVAELAFQGRRMEVRREMLALARSRRYGGIVDDWNDLAHFRDRRRFIADGLRDHRRGRYRVSIPTLLPHLEGILVEAFPPLPTKKKSTLNLVLEAVGVTNAVMGELTVDVATVLWEHIPFETATPADRRRLNRHLILHGRSTGWASEVNSARVLFAFDLVASLVKDAQRNGRKKSG